MTPAGTWIYCPSWYVAYNHGHFNSLQPSTHVTPYNQWIGFLGGTSKPETPYGFFHLRWFFWHQRVKMDFRLKSMETSTSQRVILFRHQDSEGHHHEVDAPWYWSWGNHWENLWCKLVGGLVAIFGIFPWILGMSSSQVTFIFFRGVAQPPTSKSHS